MDKTAVVAIGGNSLILDKTHPDVLHQWDAVRETCRHLANMIEAGWKIAITHGNGPQVGYIIRRNELASGEVHTTPLDIIVADTQGSIGYMLQQGLKNEMYARGQRIKVAAVVTQILVNGDDPAFEAPTKPIGAFMTREEAARFEAEGWQVVEDAGRGWRRVVASPQPLRIIEEQSVRDLIAADNIVIAAGGGGIPVVHNREGELRELQGVFAVIDKDRASRLLAERIDADLLLISTGVEKVSLYYNTPEQVDLDTVSAEKMADYYAEGHFLPGSMGPKIEAALEFVNATGKPAIITNPPNLARALAKETGTHIYP